jgi:hypothetical protein
MILEITPRVIFESNRIFGEVDSKYVLKVFSETDCLSDYPSEVERIRLAIILGSKGSLIEFEKYINMVKIDYRDVLMSVGLADELWKDKLIKKGFESLKNKHFNNENNQKYRYTSEMN